TRSHQPLDYYLRDQEEQVTTTVKIEVHHTVAKHLQWERNYYGFVEETAKGETVYMTFAARDLDNGFARWLMMFADQAKIVEPESLKKRVQELLTASLKSLNG